MKPAFRLAFNRDEAAMPQPVPHGRGMSRSDPRGVGSARSRPDSDQRAAGGRVGRHVHRSSRRFARALEITRRPRRKYAARP